MNLIQDLLRKQHTDFSLSGEFYRDQDVFEAEMDAFLLGQWMLAGHVSSIPGRGDFFVFEMAGHSVIVVRAGADADEVAAFHNVCRHRGAKVCEVAKGNSKTFYCRYHAWSYKLTGELAAWRHMPEGLDKSEFGLLRCGLKVFNGAIFLSLAPEKAPDFDKMVEHVAHRWERYDLAHTQVVHQEVYDLEANWKLGVENNLECYHCLSGHPEYTAAHSFVKADEKAGAKAVEEFESFHQAWVKSMESTSVEIGISEYIETGGQLCRAMTWGIGPNHMTGSMDGAKLAPLLGKIAAYDSSVTSGCFGYCSYIMAYGDYAVLIAYVPQSARRTLIQFTWLVRAGSVVGKDFTLGDVTALWDVTTKQDKDLIELNARGVDSPAYRPGPYSELEWCTADFIGRYKGLMAAWCANNERAG